MKLTTLVLLALSLAASACSHRTERPAVSEATPFVFDGMLPFCVPSLTSSEIDDVITPQPSDGPYYGRIDGLSLSAASEFYWNKETLTVNASAELKVTDTGVVLDSIALNNPCLGNQPSTKVCGFSTGSYAVDSPPSSPIVGQWYLRASASWTLGIRSGDYEGISVFYNTTDSSYTVVFTLGFNAIAAQWDGFSWVDLVTAWLTTISLTAGSGNPPFLTVDTFGATPTGFYLFSNSSFPVFIAMSMSDWTDEGDFTYPAP